MSNSLPSYTSADVTSHLKRAFGYRETLRLNTNAMRLVNGQGDSLEGLIIDRFNQHFVAYLLDKSWHRHKAVVSQVLSEHFKVAYLVFKDRSVSDTRNPAQIGIEVMMGQGNSQTVVEENGLRFHVDLEDHLNQGLFLDMRKNRQRVAFHAPGRTVLNCFAYTCAFGVYCRKSEASRVVNVDISAKFLQKGKENYHLNDLSEGHGEFIRDNAVRYLEVAVKKNNFFDIIILDPPSFSRFEGAVFSVKKDMPMLIEKAFCVLAPEGTLFISTNLSSISRPRIEEWAHIAARKIGRKINEVNRLGQDVDFRGSGLMKESSLSAVLLKTV